MDAAGFSSPPLGGGWMFFPELPGWWEKSPIASPECWRHFKKTQMFNYCASDHTFTLGCRPKKKKKARVLQLKCYKVLNFTLELNTLQWQISKAICMVFSWKAEDPKFLCLTGSDFPPWTRGFCSSPHSLWSYKLSFFFFFPFFFLAQRDLKYRREGTKTKEKNILVEMTTGRFEKIKQKICRHLCF